MDPISEDWPGTCRGIVIPDPSRPDQERLEGTGDTAEDSPEDPEPEVEEDEEEEVSEEP